MRITFNVPDDLLELISQESYIDGDIIVLKLGDRFDNKEVRLAFNLNDIRNSLIRLEEKIKEDTNISDQEYNKIEIIIQDSINSANVSDDQQSSDLTKIRKVVANKYSQNRKGPLYEAVLVNDVPYFVTLDDTNRISEIKLVQSIEEPTRILIPPTIDEYLTEPYTFQSKEEIDSYLEKARKETTFSLYNKAKLIVSKYVDQESHIVNLIPINIVSSYFQDRFSTVHYVGIFGDNGTGKSSIGDTFEAVSYRPLNTTDPTPANIFRSLGNVEPGQITLVLDESERIDQNPDMMSILKTGYDIRKTVHRVNKDTGKPEKFNAYCIKIIIGERPPSPILGKGVNERILGDIVFYGNPQYDIKEVLNPTKTGGLELKELLAEITEFRKTMFVYKLLHFRDHISNIVLDIRGRNKELIKPYLQLFSSFKTEEEKQIYKEIEDTFTTLLAIKNEKKTSTLEFALIPLIIDLMEESKTKLIKFSDLWDRLPYYIKGTLNKNRPNEYNTEDYGTIYRNTLSSTLEKLGVKTKRQNSFVKLLFDRKKIRKTVSQYGFVIQEKMGEYNSERCERSEGSVDRYSEDNKVEGENNAKMQSENDHRTAESGSKNAKNDENGCLSKTSDSKKSDYFNKSVHSVHSVHPSNDILKPNLYRIGNTDTIGCSKCKMKGDKWFMNDHPCSRSLYKP